MTLLQTMTIIIGVTTLVMAGCNSGSGGSSGDEAPPPGGDEAVSFRVETLVDDLRHPWSLAFLPGDRRILVTERPGELLLIDPENPGDRQVVTGVPEVASGNQGGLLDVALHPDFTNYPYVYLSYAAADADGQEDGFTTHVGRGRLDEAAAELIDFQVLHVATPYVPGDGHYGSRMVFDEHWHLYVTIGDRRDRGSAQALDSHHGKVLRLARDGTIPDSNPFVDDDHALAAIYTWGHRNPQGMAVHPETGIVWLHEHGPQAGDEVNILPQAPSTESRVSNFGWPEATYGREYGPDGEPIGDLPSERDDLANPAHYWDDTSFAPSGMAFYDQGDAFPGWQESLFVGSLVRENLTRLSLSNDLVTGEEVVLDGHGRIRDVRVGPEDGYVYVLVDADPAPLLRLVPGDGGQ